MAPGTSITTGELLEKRDFPSLIKRLDAEIENASTAGADTTSLRLNRVACLQQVGLYRKALKVGPLWI